jgi:hypothetical protein
MKIFFLGFGLTSHNVAVFGTGRVIGGLRRRSRGKASGKPHHWKDIDVVLLLYIIVFKIILPKAKFIGLHIFVEVCVRKHI